MHHSETAKTGVRRNPRFALDISVRVFSNSGERMLGRGHDFSLGGMALYAPIELTVGQRIRLSFVLPYSRLPIEVSAIVCNRQGFRYGVEFVHLSTEVKNEVNRVTSVLQLTDPKS